MSKCELLACFASLMLQVVAGAQQDKSIRAPAQSKQIEAMPVPSYPESKLVLAQGKPVAGVDRSPIVIRPLQCTSKGDVLMEIPVPPTYNEFRVVSLGRSGGHSFNFNAIPGLFDSLLLSFFPSDSDIVFLFNAAEENKEIDYRMLTDKGKVVAGKANRSEHHEYAVRFGPDGQYKSKILLPDGKQYFKIAVLPSGELLLLSYDPVNRTPLLQVLASDGKQLNSLPLQRGIADYRAIRRGASGDEVDAAKASASVGTWQFIAARSKVLLYRPNSRASILEIGARGSVRDVPIVGPNGYELEALIASSDHWFGIFRRSDVVDDRNGIDSSVSKKNFAMAELNPLDGSVERLFEMDDGSFFNIACEVDGQFLSYSVDSGSQFLLSVTDIPN